MNAQTTLQDLLGRRIGEIQREAPHLAGFFASHGLTGRYDHLPLGSCLDSLPESHYEDIGVDRHCLVGNLAELWRQGLSQAEKGFRVASVTICGGRDKRGQAESVTLELVPGEVTSIVGPTGSGKSRLLADIEWMAQGDTPTGRRILVNGRVPDPELRFSLEHKLVAQLSQNMNFVMDASVADFVSMHAEARGIQAGTLVDSIIERANQLAGESFQASTPVTALSGGQSRALMIADTAFLSSSPVVLIDEVENAGIDRKRALELLVSQDKIVLIATHDPILALMAQRRVVIANGGISRILNTSQAERDNLAALEEMDARICALRQRLRRGDAIESV